jgi:hypothetical protein
VLYTLHGFVTFPCFPNLLASVDSAIYSSLRGETIRIL